MFLLPVSCVFKGGYRCSGDVRGLQGAFHPESSEMPLNAAAFEVASDFSVDCSMCICGRFPVTCDQQVRTVSKLP